MMKTGRAGRTVRRMLTVVLAAAATLAYAGGAPDTAAAHHCPPIADAPQCMIGVVNECLQSPNASTCTYIPYYEVDVWCSITYPGTGCAEYIVGQQMPGKVYRCTDPLAAGTLEAERLLLSARPVDAANVLASTLVNFGNCARS